MGKPEPLSITTPLPEMVFWHDEKNISNINPTSQGQMREVIIPNFFFKGIKRQAVSEFLSAFFLSCKK